MPRGALVIFLTLLPTFPTKAQVPSIEWLTARANVILSAVIEEDHPLTAPPPHRHSLTIHLTRAIKPATLPDRLTVLFDPPQEEPEHTFPRFRAPPLTGEYLFFLNERLHPNQPAPAAAIIRLSPQPDREVVSCKFEL